MKEITQVDVRGKKVLVRSCLDSPLENGEIVDDSRIRASLATINYLIENNASQIIMVGKLGRPEGRVVPELSLKPVAERIGSLLKLDNYRQENLKDFIDSDLDWTSFHFKSNIIILENIRFDPGEEKNSNELAKKLASLADIYVNDDFSVSHRNEASVSAITKYLPSYAGLQLIKEIEKLSKIIKNPNRPLGIIIGGIKSEDKLPAIKNLSTLADFFLLGGVVANTFLVARGHNVGKSLYDKDLINEAKRIWTLIMDDPARDIFLPRDFTVSKSIQESKETKIIGLKDIEQIKDSDYAIVDIGPRTTELYSSKIKSAKTIFWNGNLGITEVEDFAKGSEKVAESIISSSSYSIIGGGDTGGFIHQKNMQDNFDFISTGGGATLEYLAGKQLPGLKVLE